MIRRQLERTRFRTAAFCLALPLSVVAGTGAALGQSANDPAEGVWRALIETPQESVEFTLELAARPSGELAAYLTRPIVNQYAVPIGAAKREGDTLQLTALGLALEHTGPTLEGVLPGAGLPLVFRRVDAVPEPAPPPAADPEPEPLWRTRAGDRIFASPAVARGVAYVPTTGGVLAAVDLNDGALLWTAGIGAPLYGEPAVDAESVYVIADDGRLYRLARADGRMVWSYALSEKAVPRVTPHPARREWDWRAPRPEIADGAIYAGYGEGGFHAIDAASGERVWRQEVSAFLRTGSAIHDHVAIVGADDGTVRALDLKSGAEVWRTVVGARIGAAPTVDGSTVLVGDRGYGLHALNAETGETKWRLHFWGSWIESEPVVANGVIYVGSSDMRRMSAIDASNGQVRWRADVYGWAWGAPAVSGQTLIVGAAAGRPYDLPLESAVSVLDRESGRLLSRFRLASAGFPEGAIAAPRLVSDQLIIATADGYIAAYTAFGEERRKR